MLQELAQKKYKVCPNYRIKEKNGPEHDTTFIMEALISGKIMGTGYGKSKKEAEKLAAKNAYLKITSPLVKSNPKNRKNKKK